MTLKTVAARCVILGASHAGAQAAVSLRQGGWEGAIELISDDETLPYQRPPLSKGFINGGMDLDKLYFRPAAVYEKLDIDLRLGRSAVSIDLDAKEVSLCDETKLSFDKLIIATGARVRQLMIPGSDDPDIMYLRTRADADQISASLPISRSAIVLGGGYIGLELAASLRKKGLAVQVLEAGERILQRVAAPEVSEMLQRIHEEEGVRFENGSHATMIKRTGQRFTVTTSTGSQHQGDMLIAGIGVVPNMEIAARCGLETGNGIIVDEFCRTSSPDVYAIGDVSFHHELLYDRHERLESVANATEQAKVAASHLNGMAKPLTAVPWFWSDQYDVKLQTAGLGAGWDEIIVRGQIHSGRKAAIFYLREGQLLAVDAINDPRSFVAVKAALANALSQQDRRLPIVDTAALGDENSDLKDALSPAI